MKNRRKKIVAPNENIENEFSERQQFVRTSRKGMKNSNNQQDQVSVKERKITFHVTAMWVKFPATHKWFGILILTPFFWETTSFGSYEKRIREWKGEKGNDRSKEQMVVREGWMIGHLELRSSSGSSIS